MLKADIVVMDMELLDTRTKDGGLTGTLIADLVLQEIRFPYIKNAGYGSNCRTVRNIPKTKTKIPPPVL